MIRAVLFDLDDTLLDINLSAFVAEYGTRTCRLISKISRMGLPSVMRAYLQAELLMSSQERDDDLLNLDFFNAEFASETGVPLDDPVIADAMAAFEAEVVPQLNSSLVNARPMPGGLDAIEAARREGLVVALATNPSFTRGAIRARMGWAGLSESDFAFVSHSGNSRRVKPSARYYLEFCRQLGIDAHECLMVGNDVKRDFPTPDIGIDVAYVGRRHPRRAYWRGSMARLAGELPKIVEGLNSRSFEPDYIADDLPLADGGAGEKTQGE